MAAEADSTSSQPLNSLTNASHLRQKRARSQLSCMPCRSGKLKCNRSHNPACDQCIKRSREDQCLYVPPPQKQKPAQNVKGRIRQLESLVVELMNAQSQNKNARTASGRESDELDDEDETRKSNEGHAVSFSQPTPPSDNDGSPLTSERNARSADSPPDVDEATKPFGQMRISKNGISYTGESHWQTILDNISDLKRDLGNDDDADGDEEADADEQPSLAATWGHAPLNGHAPIRIPNFNASTTSGMGFMLHHAAPATKDDLIAGVPEKRVADRLLSLWFNSPDPFKSIIHGPEFQQEYKAFWRNPRSTPAMWLGLLFSIMSLASSFGLRDVEPTAPAAQNIMAEVARYHSLAASAAVLADFTKPKPYTIECLILYAAGLRSNDAFVNVWLMIGLVIRLGLRMGYHRDPDNYSAISPFDGEMRRRTWALISMIDVLISFQLGLPSMVKTLQSDTQPPRNILDRDFHKKSTSLPPNRTVDELTPCSYIRAKLSLTRIFADATELSHATIAPAYQEMMRLDDRLEKAKILIPPLLQMPDISEIVTDPAEQLMCRFNLDLLYLKTKIIIHRGYMQKPFASLTAEEQQLGIGNSRKLCVDAALKVMQHHHTIYNASQSGGQLESVKWYMGSISTHDFLLASMVVCLELSQQINNDAAINPCGGLCPHRAAMMDALEKSQKIWSDASGRKRTSAQFVGTHEKIRAEHMFDETERASRAMGVMLEKVRASFPVQAQALEQTREEGSWASEAGTTHQTPAVARFQSFGPFAYLPEENHSHDFSGVLSNHSWSDGSGVAEQGFEHSNTFAAASNDGAPPGLYYSDLSQPNSNDTSPDIHLAQGDYAMIGDMFDVQGTLNWQMLDGALQPGKGLQAPWASGSLSADAGELSFPVPEAENGNAQMVGSDTTDPTSHASLPRDSSKISSPDRHIHPGSWMSFPDMQTVDFDIDSIMANTRTGLTPGVESSYQWPEGTT